MTRRVLVTGAAGYIGRHVISAILDQGDRVVASDHSAGSIDPRAEFVQASLADLPNRIGSHGIDACVHLAWRNGFDHRATSHIEDLPLHFNFLTALVTRGITDLTCLGTMHEVGYWEGAIDAETPCRPRSLYGIAKNALRDAVFATLADSITLRWLRAYYILGDDHRNKSLFSKILAWSEEGRRSFPLTSGRNKFDFIPVDELGAQIAAAAAQTDIVGIINCCTGRPISLGEQVELFIRQHGLTITPDFGAFPDRTYDSPGVWGDPGKIQAILSARAPYRRQTIHAI